MRERDFSATPAPAVHGQQPRALSRHARSPEIVLTPDRSDGRAIRAGRSTSSSRRSPERTYTDRAAQHGRQTPGGGSVHTNYTLPVAAHATQVYEGCRRSPSPSSSSRAHMVSRPPKPELSVQGSGSPKGAEAPLQVPSLTVTEELAARICQCGNPCSFDAEVCHKCGSERCQGARCCDACGNALLSDAVFCRNCGVPCTQSVDSTIEEGFIAGANTTGKQTIVEGFASHARAGTCFDRSFEQTVDVMAGVSDLADSFMSQRRTSNRSSRPSSRGAVSARSPRPSLAKTSADQAPPAHRETVLAEAALTSPEGIRLPSRQARDWRMAHSSSVIRDGASEAPTPKVTGASVLAPKASRLPVAQQERVLRSPTPPPAGSFAAMIDNVLGFGAGLTPDISAGGQPCPGTTADFRSAGIDPEAGEAQANLWNYRSPRNPVSKASSLRSAAKTATITPTPISPSPNAGQGVVRSLASSNPRSSRSGNSARPHDR